MSSNTKSNIQIVSLDGNIGSGKSTLMNYFIQKKEMFEKQSPDTEFVFLLEPVDEWTDICDESGIPILTKFYENIEKYAFSFQMMVYLSRLSLIKKAVDKFRKNGTKQKLVILTERSLLTDKEVFCKMLYDNKQISKIDYSIYNKWYNTFSHEYKVSKILYLNVYPVLCSERTMKRSREGENKISLDYLWLCDKYHKGMVYNFELEHDKKNILKLKDNNLDTDIDMFLRVIDFVSFD
jgi:deoxyadenosine/deoxycytidine kinase